MKVLCVDDEPINLMILERILGKKYKVISAENGPKALEILQKDPEIQLVVTDMQMPGMSGIELIRQTDKQFPGKKYFMLSGYDITQEIQEALDSSLISAYFQKPPDFKKLEEALQENF